MSEESLSACHILIHAFNLYLKRIDYDSKCIDKQSGEIRTDELRNIMNQCIEESYNEWKKAYSKYIDISLEEVKYGTPVYHDEFVRYVSLAKLSPLASESTFRFLCNDLIIAISDYLEYGCSRDDHNKTYKESSNFITGQIIFNMNFIECDNVELFTKYLMTNIRKPEIRNYYAPTTQAFANIVAIAKQYVIKQKKLNLFE